MLLPLADGPGSPVDQGVATLLFVATILLGFVAFQRVRGRGFAKLPKPAGWIAASLATVSLVLAVVLPPLIRPDISAARPSSPARLEILAPHPGQAFSGEPASIPVRLRLTGGRVVSFSSTKLVPNEGHIHLYLDGILVSMGLALSANLKAGPGSHRLEAEFVAVDHGPFDPRVRTSVAFLVRP